MNYKEIGEQIFIDNSLFVESQSITYGINLNDERFLEILTHKVILNSREYDSPLVMTAAKEKLREYLNKYTSYQIDKEEIIDFYYKKATEKIILDLANKRLEKIKIKDLSKITDNIKELRNINLLLKKESDITIYDAGEVLKENLTNGFVIEGTPSGLDSLDTIIGGFRNSELTHIAARPGIGKTAMMCQLISNISKTKNVGVFSAEMKRNIIVNRILACETGIDSRRLARVNENNYQFLTNQEKEMIAMKSNNFIKRIIKIIDKPNINIDLLYEKAIEMKKDYKIDIFMIDYTQLLTCDIKDSRREQLIYTTRTQKGLARELDLPIIALAQLNRDADGKRPVLRDLKDSGSIEEDSDMIIFLHEPGETNKINPLTEIIVSKNRNGPIGITKAIHDKPISRFTRW
jgi:replicative DNA helicase